MVGSATIAVECTECGIGKGSADVTSDRTSLRCNNCGRFAQETDRYCARHEVRIDRLTGYDHCPKCREESRVNRMEHERMARRADPRKHPTVDANRY